MNTERITIEIKESKNGGYRVAKIADKLYWGKKNYGILHPMEFYGEECEKQENIVRGKIRMDCLLNIHDEIEKLFREIDNYETHENLDFYTEVCTSVNKDYAENALMEKTELEVLEKVSPNGIFRIIAVLDMKNEFPVSFCWEDLSSRQLTFIIGQKLEKGFEEDFNNLEDYLIDCVMREAEYEINQSIQKINRGVANAYDYDKRQLMRNVCNEIISEEMLYI